MQNKFIILVGTMLCILFLLTSLGANILLYRQGYEYYLQVNEIRLDPLGLNVFATKKLNDTHFNEKMLAIFMGDSRAADWTVPNKVNNFNFINRGINAQTTAQVLGRFTYHVLSLNPDTLVLQVGINDLKTIPLFPNRKAEIIAKCKANIQEMVELTVHNNIQMILTTIFPLGVLPIERRPFWSDDVALAVDDVNQFIVGLARDRVKILDTARILSDKQGNVVSLYSKDFLHLNKVGYEVLNRKLEKVLQP
jgi:lysophospholipase L1-like esterase